jgi:glutamine amidotransferase
MLAIIDYRAGNLTSVRLAFEALGIEAQITDDPAAVRRASRVVFPGVGAAGAAMENVRRLGIGDAIRDAIAAGTPFLGICVGTQILFDASEEDGGTTCLGVLPGRVRLFRPSDARDKVPHMGWNQVAFRPPVHPVLDGLAGGSEFYFVHSYYPDPARPEDARGVTDYAGTTFASIVGRGNLLATQFHPEKSGRTGMRLLANFARWDGRAPEKAG